ncbi:alpha-D-ribose 1-methylphosphonate 5-triphosphate diphosphatase [Saccharopolyspora antimicrobica]|uniref:Alpha-D-ribose 1-methylphosphonate 5-triphosphate diphosphatase n=1 Tax=Saccharopolyspora antimicrobica TaxID=455193 RepID=A0A1I5AF84_9PSEU|nr:alpha-D-ribose 1-methylphosphonate 5-triphosphate diphosphatase [Saccharopolyspora antimicrobica]RKT83158.1 alpha-D-ribose 1-methylphosphonate 5-triphosphate diphosphatase [Saccharopolyspora antimicrobica]SFN61103.1 alpha-D-ribose 1-methylphosphonate 5-triphosphate diphosphatase [Saccharopolyspora antimicrobica]
MSSAVGVQSWSLAATPQDYVLGHVRAVLPERVTDDSRIVVRGGRIEAVEDHPAGASCDVDGGGLLCIPGLIDVHSDALERERMPRPSAVLPWDFALLSLEGKLRAAAVTTVFHGAAFQHKTSRGTERTVGGAAELCETVRARGAGPVDHRVLYRLDVRSAEGAKALAAELAVADRGALVSHEDHTPGIGQYVDRRQLERYLVGADGLTPDEAEQHVTDMIAERGELLDVREDNLAWLGELARAGEIRLLGHDPESAEEIGALCTRGGAVAEFPTTTAAAVAAREHGLPVVAGAPNVLRGHSHAGNVSARELACRGLVTALASDYLPSGLLAAVFRLVDDLGLPAALALVTAGPAEVAGLADRGRLEPGLRADLALVDPSGRWPQVRAVLPGGAA